MPNLLAVALAIGGFLVLLGTFTTIGRFGSASRVKASVLLLILTLVSAVVGPFYDMLLWTVVQGMVTIHWFLFYPSDSLLSGGISGPLVLLAGVIISTASVLPMLGALPWVALGLFEASKYEASFSDLALGTAGGAVGTFVFSAAFGTALTVWLFGKRIKSRWRQGINALKTIEQRAK